MHKKNGRKRTALGRSIARKARSAPTLNHGRAVASITSFASTNTTSLAVNHLPSNTPGYAMMYPGPPMMLPYGAANPPPFAAVANPASHPHPQFMGAPTMQPTLPMVSYPPPGLPGMGYNLHPQMQPNGLHMLPFGSPQQPTTVVILPVNNAGPLYSSGGPLPPPYFQAAPQLQLHPHQVGMLQPQMTLVASPYLMPPPVLPMPLASPYLMPPPVPQLAFNPLLVPPPVAAAAPPPIEIVQAPILPPPMVDILPPSLRQGPLPCMPTKKKRRRRPPVKDPFPNKLYRLLMASEPNGTQDICSFTASGLAFRIHSEEEFISQVAPRYFRLRKFASLERQLGTYGFDLAFEGGDDYGALRHDFFQRGKPELLKFIQAPPPDYDSEDDEYER